MKACQWEGLYKNVAVLFLIVKIYKQTNCSPTGKWVNKLGYIYPIEYIYTNLIKMSQLLIQTYMTQKYDVEWKKKTHEIVYMNHMKFKNRQNYIILIENTTVVASSFGDGLETRWEC